MAKLRPLLFLISEENTATGSLLKALCKKNQIDFYSHPDNEFLDSMIKEQNPKWIIGSNQKKYLNFFKLGSDIDLPLNLKKITEIVFSN